MVKRLDLKTILKENPRVNKEELEELHRIIRELHGDQASGPRQTGHKFAPPYSRPSVHRDRGEKQLYRTVQLTRS